MGSKINPKSLKGKDKLNRVKDLMSRMTTLNESVSLSELELVKKGPNKVIYGVVRENRKYFIKTTDKTSGELHADDFNYIGGLENKFVESYDSYAAATKQLNFKFDMLNESLGINDNVNILESDGTKSALGFGFVIEDEEIEKEVIEDEVVEDEVEVNVNDLEEQKKVLKVDAPTPAPIAEPSMEEPFEDEVMDEPMMDDPMASDDMDEPTEDDGDDESDPTKKIQKMTGKIGQMLRDMDEPDVDLEKYVINSVISAMNLDQFSDEDIEDIVSKLESEDEEDDMASDNMGDDLGMDEPSLEEPVMDEPEMEMPAMTEESFKITKADLVESLTKKILKDTLNESDDYGRLKPSSERVRRSVSKRRKGLKGKNYSSKQMRTFDKDRDGVPFEKEDFRRLRKSKRRNENEDLLDEDLTLMFADYEDEYDMDYNDSGLNDNEGCQCGGIDCPHCGGQEEDFMMLNADGEYGPFDRDGDDIPADIDLDDDNDGDLDIYSEDDGYGVDVMDSVSGSFDMDGDDIPSKIDNSMYGDGELDGLDIEFFSDNAPTKEPKVKPGTKNPPKRRTGSPMWNPKPKVSPNPKASDESSEKRSFRRRGWYK